MDRMDELLDRIGAEANEKIDFEAALFEVLAKAQAKEQERSQQVARKKPWMQARYLSMAAGVVLLVGAAVLLNRGGLMKGAGSGAPESAQPQLAMATASADTAAGAAEAAPEDVAPAPAAFAAPAEGAAPAEDSGVMAGQSRITGAPFYGSATITVPAAGSACTETGSPNSAGSTPLPEEALRNGSHDAYDTKGGICRIGETTRLTAQEKLAALGYTACFSTDAYVDQLAALLPGEACIANAGEIAVWNTGDGFLTLWNPTLSQVELYDLLMQAV